MVFHVEHVARNILPAEWWVSPIDYWARYLLMNILVIFHTMRVVLMARRNTVNWIKSDSSWLYMRVALPTAQQVMSRQNISFCLFVPLKGIVHSFFTSFQNPIVL